MTLRKNNIFDLHEEKFNQLNILPSTPYDMYNRLLRSIPPAIKQSGAPQDEETRDMEVMTEEISLVDKEIQFCYGDDTALLNAMAAITRRKKVDGSTSKGDTISHVESTDEEVFFSGLKSASVKKSNPQEGQPTSAHASTRLALFLQRSSQVFVSLLEEHRHALVESRGKAASKQAPAIFERSASPVMIGHDIADPGNEYIRLRPVVAVRFSTLQPHVFMTAHPYEDDAEDLKPFTVRYACGPDCVIRLDIISLMIDRSSVPASGNLLFVGCVLAGGTHLDIERSRSAHCLLSIRGTKLFGICRDGRRSCSPLGSEGECFFP